MRNIITKLEVAEHKDRTFWTVPEIKNSPIDFNDEWPIFCNLRVLFEIPEHCASGALVLRAIRHPDGYRVRKIQDRFQYLRYPGWEGSFYSSARQWLRAHTRHLAQDLFWLTFEC